VHRFAEQVVSAAGSAAVIWDLGRWCRGGPRHAGGVAGAGNRTGLT